MEVVWWVATLALLSPMVVYAGEEVPVVALFGVAAGIAIALMLTGRRLYDVLIEEGLRRRQGALRWVWAVGVLLVGVSVVLLAAVFVIAVAIRGRAPSVPY